MNYSIKHTEGRENMANDFYRLTEIKKHKAQYNILLGERANGKSYAVKEEVLKKAIEKKACVFALVRRLDADIKPSVIGSYMDDMPVNKLTKGEYNTISYYQRYFYVANVDDKGKVTRGYKIGCVFALADDERYKSSTVLPDIEYVIFEEFTTNKLYLRDEVTRFMNLVSTIMRLKNGVVYMIANKISRVCPYFNEWGLRGIPRQVEGQIDEYIFKSVDNVEVKICVELCASPKHTKSGMFFGTASKSIEGGEWQTSEHPHLQGDLSEYDILYKMSLIAMDFRFNIMLLCHSKDDYLCVYVYPASIKTYDRVLTEKYSTDYQITPNLHANNRAEVLIHKLINDNKMVFPNNLIAEDFYTVIKNMKKNPFSLS